LSPGPDEFCWNLHSNGGFSVDSLYKVIQYDIPVDNNKKIWKMKIPFKPNFWMVSSSRVNPNQRYSCKPELAWKYSVCVLSPRRDY
jgi:hypothetical protein